MRQNTYNFDNFFLLLLRPSRVASLCQNRPPSLFELVAALLPVVRIIVKQEEFLPFFRQGVVVLLVEVHQGVKALLL